MKPSFSDLLHKALDLIGDLDVDVHSLVRDVESLHGTDSDAKSPGFTPGDNDDTHSSDILSSSAMCHGEARHALVERAMLVVQSMREDLDWLLMDISAQQRDAIANDETHDAHGRPDEECGMVKGVAAATAAAKRWRVRAENARQQAVLAQELAVAKVLDAGNSASLAQKAASEAEEYEQQGLLPSALRAVQEASMHHVTAESSEQRAWELQEESKHRAAEANAAMLHAAAAELQANKLELKAMQQAVDLAARMSDKCHHQKAVAEQQWLLAVSESHAAVQEAHNAEEAAAQEQRHALDATEAGDAAKADRHAAVAAKWRSKAQELAKVVAASSAQEAALRDEHTTVAADAAHVVEELQRLKSSHAGLQTAISAALLQDQQQLMEVASLQHVEWLLTGNEALQQAPLGQEAGLDTPTLQHLITTMLAAKKIKAWRRRKEESLGTISALQREIDATEAEACSKEEQAVRLEEAAAHLAQQGRADESAAMLLDSERLHQDAELLRGQADRAQVALITEEANIRVACSEALALGSELQQADLGSLQCFRLAEQEPSGEDARAATPNSLAALYFIAPAPHSEHSEAPPAVSRSESPISALQPELLPLSVSLGGRQPPGNMFVISPMGSSELSEAPSLVVPESADATPLLANMACFTPPDISRQSETGWDDLQSEGSSGHESCESLKAASKRPAGTWRRLQATALAASRFARQAQAVAAGKMQEAEHLAAQVEHCLEFSKGVLGGIEAASLQHLEHAVTAEADSLQVAASSSLFDAQQAEAMLQQTAQQLAELPIHAQLQQVQAALKEVTVSRAVACMGSVDRPFHDDPSNTPQAAAVDDLTETLQASIRALLDDVEDAAAFNVLQNCSLHSQDSDWAGEPELPAVQQHSDFVERGIQLKVLAEHVLELQSSRATAEQSQSRMKSAVQAVSAAKRLQRQKESQAQKITRAKEAVAARLAQANGAQAEALAAELDCLNAESAQADLEVAATTLEAVAAEESGRAAIQAHHRLEGSIANQSIVVRCISDLVADTCSPSARTSCTTIGDDGGSILRSATSLSMKTAPGLLRAISMRHHAQQLARGLPQGAGVPSAAHGHPSTPQDSTLAGSLADAINTLAWTHEQLAAAEAAAACSTPDAGGPHGEIGTETASTQVQHVEDLQKVAEAVVELCTSASNMAQAASEHQKWVDELHASLQAAEGMCQEAEEAEASFAQEAASLQQQGNVMEAVVMQQQAEDCRRVGMERKNAINTLATTITAAHKWTSTLKAAKLSQQQQATKLSQMLTHAKDVAHSTDVLQLQDKKRLDLLQQQAQLQDRCTALQEEVMSFDNQATAALKEAALHEAIGDFHAAALLKAQAAESLQRKDMTMQCLSTLSDEAAAAVLELDVVDRQVAVGRAEVAKMQATLELAHNAASLALVMSQHGTLCSDKVSAVRQAHAALQGHQWAACDVPQQIAALQAQLQDPGNEDGPELQELERKQEELQALAAQVQLLQEQYDTAVDALNPPGEHAESATDFDQTIAAALQMKEASTIGAHAASLQESSHHLHAKAKHAAASSMWHAAQAEVMKRKIQAAEAQLAVIDEVDDVFVAQIGKWREEYLEEQSNAEACRLEADAGHAAALQQEQSSQEMASKASGMHASAAQLAAGLSAVKVAMHWKKKAALAVNAASAAFQLKEKAALQAEQQLQQTENLVDKYNSAGKFIEAANAAQAAAKWQKKALAARLDVQANSALLTEAAADAEAAARALKQAEESERELRSALKPWLQVVQVKAAASKWKKFAQKRTAATGASSALDEEPMPASATQAPQAFNSAGSSQLRNSKEICRQLHLAVLAQNQAVQLQLKKAALTSHADGTKARCNGLMAALADDERGLSQLEQELEAAKHQGGPGGLAAMQRMMELQHMLAATALEAHQAGLEHLAAQQQACLECAELEKCQVRSHTANCIARLLREVDEDVGPGGPMAPSAAQRKELLQSAAAQAQEVLILQLQLLDNEAGVQKLRLAMVHENSSGLLMDKIARHTAGAHDIAATLMASYQADGNVMEADSLRECMAALAALNSNVTPRSAREQRRTEVQAHLEAGSQAGAVLRQQLEQSLQTQDSLAVALQADEEVSTWMSSLLQAEEALRQAEITAAMSEAHVSSCEASVQEQQHVVKQLVLLAASTASQACLVDRHGEGGSMAGADLPKHASDLAARLAGDGSSLWEAVAAEAKQYQLLCQEFIDAAAAGGAASEHATQARHTLLLTEHTVKAAERVLQGCISAMQHTLSAPPPEDDVLPVQQVIHMLSEAAKKSMLEKDRSVLIAATEELQHHTELRGMHVQIAQGRHAYAAVVDVLQQAEGIVEVVCRVRAVNAARLRAEPRETSMHSQDGGQDGSTAASGTQDLPWAGQQKARWLAELARIGMDISSAAESLDASDELRSVQIELNKLQQELKHVLKQRLDAKNCIGVLERLDAKHPATGTKHSGASPLLPAQSQQVAVSLLNFKIEECRGCDEKVLHYEALHQLLRRLLASLLAHERFHQPTPLNNPLKSAVGLRQLGCDASAARCRRHSMPITPDTCSSSGDIQAMQAALLVTHLQLCRKATEASLLELDLVALTHQQKLFASGVQVAQLSQHLGPALINELQHVLIRYGCSVPAPGLHEKHIRLAADHATTSGRTLLELAAYVHHEVHWLQQSAEVLQLAIGKGRKLARLQQRASITGEQQAVSRQISSEIWSMVGSALRHNVILEAAWANHPAMSAVVAAFEACQQKLEDYICYDSHRLSAFGCTAASSVNCRTSAEDLSSPFLLLSPTRGSSGAGWDSQRVQTMDALADSARSSYLATTRAIQSTMAQLEQDLESSRNHMQLSRLDAHLPGLQEESECAGRLAALAREDAAAALAASGAAHAEALAAAAILATLTPQDGTPTDAAVQFGRRVALLEAQACKAAVAAAESSRQAEAAELRAAGLSQELVGKQRVRQLLRSLFDHERTTQKLSGSNAINQSLEQQLASVLGDDTDGAAGGLQGVVGAMDDATSQSMLAAMAEHAHLLKMATRHSQQLLTSLAPSPGTAATPEAAMAQTCMERCGGALGTVAALPDRVRQAQQVAESYEDAIHVSEELMKSLVEAGKAVHTKAATSALSNTTDVHDAVQLAEYTSARDDVFEQVLAMPDAARKALESKLLVVNLQCAAFSDTTKGTDAASAPGTGSSAMEAAVADAGRCAAQLARQHTRLDQSRQRSALVEKILRQQELHHESQGALEAQKGLLEAAVSAFTWTLRAKQAGGDGGNTVLRIARRWRQKSHPRYLKRLQLQHCQLQHDANSVHQTLLLATRSLDLLKNHHFWAEEGKSKTEANQAVEFVSDAVQEATHASREVADNVQLLSSSYLEMSKATQLAAEMTAAACNARKLAEEQQHNAHLYMEDAERATLQSKFHGSLVQSFHARGYSMSENCIQAEVSAARCEQAAQDAQAETSCLEESSTALLMEAEAAEKKLQQLQQDMELQARVCDMLTIRVAATPSDNTEDQQEAEACLKLAAQHMNECLAAQSAAGICEQKQQLARQKSQLLRNRSMNLSMRQQCDAPPRRQRDAGGLHPRDPGHWDAPDHSLAVAAALANAATDVEGNQAAFFALKANLSRQCAWLYKATVQQMEALIAADARMTDLTLALAKEQSVLSKAKKKAEEAKAHVQKLKAAFQETQANLAQSQAACNNDQSEVREQLVSNLDQRLGAAVKDLRACKRHLATATKDVLATKEQHKQVSQWRELLSTSVSLARQGAGVLAAALHSHNIQAELATEVAASKVCMQQETQELQQLQTQVSSLEREAASISTMEVDDLANLAMKKAQLQLLQPAVQQAEQRAAQSALAFQHVAEQYSETHNHSIQAAALYVSITTFIDMLPQQLPDRSWQEAALAHLPQPAGSLVHNVSPVGGALAASIQLRQAATAAAGIRALLRQAEASAAVRQAQHAAESMEVDGRQLDADMHKLRAEMKLLAHEEEKMQLLGRSSDVEAVRVRLVATTASEHDLAGRRQALQEDLAQQDSIVQQCKLQVQLHQQQQHLCALVAAECSQMLQLDGQLQSHHQRPFQAACATLDKAASHLDKALKVLATREPQQMPQVDRWRGKAAKAVACLGFVKSLQPRAKPDSSSRVGARASAVDKRAVAEQKGAADAATCGHQRYDEPLDCTTLANSHLNGNVETATLDQPDDIAADWSSASSSASSDADHCHQADSPRAAADNPVACSSAAGPPAHGNLQPLSEQQPTVAPDPCDPADSCAELPPEPVAAWSNNLSRVHLHRALSIQKSIKPVRSRAPVIPGGMLQDIAQQADDQQSPAEEPAPPGSTHAAAALAVYSAHLLAQIYRSISEVSNSWPTTLAPLPLSSPHCCQGQGCGLTGMDGLYQEAVQRAACLEAAGSTALPNQQPADALQLIRDTFCKQHAQDAQEAAGALDMLLQLLVQSSGHTREEAENETISALQAVHESFGLLRSHHGQNAESLAFKLDQLERWGNTKSQAASKAWDKAAAPGIPDAIRLEKCAKLAAQASSQHGQLQKQLQVATAAQQSAQDSMLQARSLLLHLAAAVAALVDACGAGGGAGAASGAAAGAGARAGAGDPQQSAGSSSGMAHSCTHGSTAAAATAGTLEISLLVRQAAEAVSCVSRDAHCLALAAAHQLQSAAKASGSQARRLQARLAKKHEAVRVTAQRAAKVEARLAAAGQSQALGPLVQLQQKLDKRHQSLMEAACFAANSCSVAAEAAQQHAQQARRMVEAQALLRQLLGAAADAACSPLQHSGIDNTAADAGADCDDWDVESCASTLSATSWQSSTASQGQRVSVTTPLQDTCSESLDTCITPSCGDAVLPALQLQLALPELSDAVLSMLADAELCIVQLEQLLADNRLHSLQTGHPAAELLPAAGAEAENDVAGVGGAALTTGGQHPPAGGLPAPAGAAASLPSATPRQPLQIQPSCIASSSRVEGRAPSPDHDAGDHSPGIGSVCVLDGRPLAYWIRPQTAEPRVQPLDRRMDATEPGSPQTSKCSPRMKGEPAGGVLRNGGEGCGHPGQGLRQHPAPTSVMGDEEVPQCQSPLIPAARYHNTGCIFGACADGSEHMAEVAPGSAIMAPAGAASEMAALEADVFGMMRELMSCQAETMALLELDHRLHEQLLNESASMVDAQLGCTAAAAAEEHW